MRRALITTRHDAQHQYMSLSLFPSSAEGDPGVCQYSRDSGDTEYIQSIQGGGHIYGRWTGGANGKIQLADAAAEKTDGWNFTFPLHETEATENYVHVTIHTSSAPDFVNLTYAHEATHRAMDTAINANLPASTDGDKVPDVWEDQIPGMSTETANSFAGEFNISGGGDTEFYSVLGGAFRYGTVKQSKNGPALAQNQYNGVVPEDADESNDWSAGGSVNWNTLEGVQ